MKNVSYWDRFAKTGNISDYLNYIACTSEVSALHMAKENEEGGYHGDSITCDGDSLISHANWRV